ncbi:MAG: response regulator [Desulfobacteraceae bacterium]|nr:MAG: response regulator [Desulfobacteraceae bacterium]
MKGTGALVDTKLAVILESDPELRENVAEVLKDRGFTIQQAGSRDELLKVLRSLSVPLAVLGREGSEDSTFKVLELVVKTSPMTSVILLTDLDESEVHEAAEGYGILGSVSRSSPHSALTVLADRFEAIMSAINS